MRIISPFKDYYDSAQAYGIDPKLNYYRKPEVFHSVQLKDYFPVPGIPDSLGYWNIIIATTGLLIVCGRIYPFLLPSKVLEFDTNRSATEQISRSLVMSPDDPLITKSVARDIFRDEAYWLRIVKDYFNYINEIRGYAVGSEIHRALRAPIILTSVSRQNWKSEFVPVPALTNPRLANFGFQSILDPFTCFQEIAQYLGNELAQHDTAPLRTGDDETIARTKGFDEQSFQTAAPGTKKLNRKTNRERKKNS